VNPWSSHRHTNTWVVAGVFFLGLAMFLPGISRPPVFLFDEVFYVPAARVLAHVPPGGQQHSDQPLVNPEVSHPPVAKLLIAAGIALAGDTPRGWRLLSAGAGALLLCAIFVWGEMLSGDRRLALWAVALTAVNNLLYVMARVGMLDVFVVLFVLWGFVAITAMLQQRISAPAGLAGAGLLFGVAMACKWLALAPLVAVWVLVLLWIWQPGFFSSPFSVLPDGQAGTEDGSSEVPTHAGGSGSRRRPETRIGKLGAGCCFLVILPLLVYCAAFVVLAGRLHQPFSVHWLAQQQFNVILSHVGHEGPPVQISRWYTWPVKLYPEVFFYGGDARWVLLLGNPLVMWPGLVAVAVLSWGCIVSLTAKNLRPAASPPATGNQRAATASFAGSLIVLLAYGSLYAQWAVAPRKTMFYHYYFPAAMVLGPALALAFANRRPQKIFGVPAHLFLLLAAVLVFVISLPLLTAMGGAWADWLAGLFF
jgi:dolichyl-phosphate-mannose--protein O-mannosyl transferase